MYRQWQDVGDGVRKWPERSVRYFYYGSVTKVRMVWSCLAVRDMKGLEGFMRPNLQGRMCKWGD